MTSNIYQKVEAQIAKIEARIAASEWTLEESRKAQVEFHAAKADLENTPTDVWHDLAERSRAAMDTDDLVRLYATLDTDLMHCTKRYVVTDEELVSPAGFHPDERVFVQTKVAHHVDDLDELPATNEQLYVHDMGGAS